MKTRFSRFYNLPELMSMFKEIADIKTADVLNLPTPEAVFENIVVKPTDLQKEMILSLGDRAERVRSRSVDVRVDNMLLITNDGRKIALDQRLYDDTLPDTENNKSSMCTNKMFEIWKETKEQKSTQICFCDLSTPKNDGSFNIYDDIKNKLIKRVSRRKKSPLFTMPKTRNNARNYLSKSGKVMLDLSSGLRLN